MKPEPIKNRLTRTVYRSTLAALLIAGMAVPTFAQEKDVLVFAAASLTNALDDINTQYQRERGRRVKISYGASSTLAKQIEAGAPADIFISADLDWMDYLAKRNLIKPATRTDLLSNRLVLVAPKDSRKSFDIARGFPLASELVDGKLAMADTAAVPAGKYGRAALEALGVWHSVRNKIVQAENVRAALLLVARGEAPYGIVYQTDAAVERSVRIAGVFPDNTHPPIVYPIALTARSRNHDAASFLAYLESPKARLLFEKRGFIILK